MRRTHPCWKVLIPLLATAWSAAPLAAQSGVCDDREAMVYQLSYIELGRLGPLLTTLGYEFVGKAGTIDCTKDPLVVELPEPEATQLVTGSSLDNPEAIPRQRVLILFRDRERLRGLLNLLHEQVDVAAKQILIEALVLELDRDHFKDLGLSYSGSKDGATLGFNTEGAGALVLGISRPSPKTVLEFTGTLSALVDRGKAEVLSRPSVLVLDGRQAMIKVGDKLPYTKLTRSTLDIEGQVVSDTVYIDIAIELTLQPRATDDDSEVSMQVVTKVNSPAGSSTINPDGSVVPPPIATREVASHVRVANNTPFIIAGLIRSTADERRAGIPVLSKVPLLGALFRRTTRNRTDKEVIVVITPHIIPSEDPLFSYNVAKDSDLLDQNDLELFRNIYRLRNRDIFDTAFVKNSSFVRELDSQVLRAADSFSEAYSSEFGLPPVARSDRAALAERMHALIRESRAPGRVTSLTGVIPPEFISVLEGVIPGEEIFVKRMLLGIIQRHDFRRLIDERSIRYFLKPYYVHPRTDGGEEMGAVCPAPPPSVPRFDDATAALDAVLGRNRPLFDLQRLPSLETLAGCETLVLCLERERTSLGVDLDAPLATASFETVDNDRFVERLVELNARLVKSPEAAGGQLVRWRPESDRLAILLNNCAEIGNGKTLDHLKDVLVLKRFLELNHELPLTLDGFHVGREITFPVEQNLTERTHIVDRETAQLFYETIDYYGAFARALHAAHGTLREAFGRAAAARAASGAPATSAAPAAPDAGRRPAVRIVVLRGDQLERPPEPLAELAWTRPLPGMPLPVEIQVERAARTGGPHR